MSADFNRMNFPLKLLGIEACMHSSVVEHLLSLHKALYSIPSTSNKQKLVKYEYSPVRKISGNRVIVGAFQ